MRIRLLETTDPDWTTSLSGAPYDITHLPGYVHAQDDFRGIASRLLVVEDDGGALLVPIAFSPMADGLSDASSPHPHAGPIFTDGSSPQWRQEAVSAAVEHLRDRGVVSLFLRAHPLLGIDEFATVGTVVEHGPTFTIPLGRSVDEIKSDMRSNHRRNMRKAARDGFVAELDHEWEHLDEVQWIYSKTMERLQARSTYRFSRGYFENLRDTLDQYCTLWVLKMEGAVAGAHIVTECNGTVQYLLGATHPDFHRKVPQVAIFDAVLQWAHERGNRNYFLGGGAHESLLHFKAGFTKTLRPATTGRIVVDSARYERLRTAWEARNGPPREDTEDFFPRYRMPVVAA